MMSSIRQLYAKKTVDFISKKEGPVYFDQVGMSEYIRTFIMPAYTRVFLTINFNLISRKKYTLITRCVIPSVSTSKSDLYLEGR